MCDLFNCITNPLLRTPFEDREFVSIGICLSFPA